MVSRPKGRTSLNRKIQLPHSWDRRYGFEKYFRQKKCEKIAGFFVQNGANFCIVWIVTLFFKEKCQFFSQKIWQKSPKIGIVTLALGLRKLLRWGRCCEVG
jgi:hypothetical protein